MKLGYFLRLCDNFKVPLDLQECHIEDISLSAIQSQFYALSKQEEIAFNKRLYESKIHIKYKVGMDPYVMGSSSATYCEPVAIDPSNIPIQEVTKLRASIFLVYDKLWPEDEADKHGGE